MLDKFYYENSAGEKVYFGQDGIYANYNNLRDYEWQYDSDGYLISNTHRGVFSKIIPAWFIADSGEECRNKRNKAFLVFERDIISNQKGRLYIGNYYMKCQIYGMTNSLYLESERKIKVDILVRIENPVWRKDETYSFYTISSEDRGGFDFPFEFPIDFACSAMTNSALNLPEMLESEFKMIIYGPAENPVVYIADHTYKMECLIQEGERLEIDSANKTIIKYDAYNTAQNYFRYRYKAESIFEKLPSNKATLNYTGNFAFDLIVSTLRSEPEWEYSELKVAESIGINSTEEYTDIIEENNSEDINDIVDEDGDE